MHNGKQVFPITGDFTRLLQLLFGWFSCSLGRKLIFAMKIGGEMVFFGTLFVSLPTSSNFLFVCFNI